MSDRPQQYTVKPAKISLLLSFENLVLVAFIILAGTFYVYFRISVVELLLVILSILVITFPVLVKLVKYSNITYTFTEKTIFQDSKWKVPKWQSRVEIKDIHKISFRQNFAQKLFDIGELYIVTQQKKTLSLYSIGHFNQSKQKIKRIIPSVN